ncbi:MAG: SDR family NAD(P)-dependent oxidoreductase [Chloroflexota bacterium]
MEHSDLEDQIAIVTGGARGIGKGIATRLALDGAKVVLIDIDIDTAGVTSKELNEKGFQTMAIETDVSKLSDVNKAVKKVCSTFGPPDILVNNAGIYTSAPLLEVKPKEWNRTLEVNLTGAFYFSQAVAIHLIKKQYGRIINISSIGGKVGWLRNHAYCASKAGLIGLTRVLALELAPYGITVNAICPGSTLTNMLVEVDENECRFEGLEKGTFLREQVNRIPLKRYAQSDDISSLVAFLVSREANHITGQAINIDGGTVMY